jgi:uncharacterized protein involved in exopolysaccharide biosynthesis
MERKPLRPVLRRRWWVPALLTCAALGVAAFVMLRAPHYEATASVVALEPVNINGTVLSFTDVATSNSVAVSALHDTKINETTDQLRTELSVVASRSTLYRVTVGYATPQGAVALANAVASDAANLYQQLAAGNSSVLAGLEQDRAKYRDQYLAAAQALVTFDSAHPLPVAGTTGDPAIEAQRLQLQVDQQAAQSAYVELQQAAAQARVNQISSAHEFEATVVDQAVARSLNSTHLLRAGFIGAIGLILGLALVVMWEYTGGRGARTGPIAAPDAAEVVPEVDLAPLDHEAMVDDDDVPLGADGTTPVVADDVPPLPVDVNGTDGHMELVAAGNSHRQTKRRVFRK